ncbi:MAG: galactokinase [Bacteroidales bacterium]|nr:galactokinase [Bacteroidales bacterium]MCF8345040.1 galactokinase [Bacteroidales bacterium]MCF8352655.1 galactokinase [Bacteroidales bacterium]MCF8377208.1 galactokinase [Bacteroidales bacterium]MCF8401079.1 galactokinase [Bacteroidales bacterium]
MDQALLKQKFIERYGKGQAPDFYFAPGRVNLIGEHTDYNGGYVLPCALSFGTYLLIRENPDHVFRFASLNFDNQEEIVIDGFHKLPNNNWVNYPLGVIDQLKNEGLKTSGMDFLFAGNIPPGAGLSSSASIELVTAFAINDQMDFKLELKDLIHISLQCEHDFIGVQCGIMDQFAVAMGKANMALFLNCRNLFHEHVPMNTGAYSIVIVNSNKARGLADSKYNERVNECSMAVEDIRKSLDIEYLGQLSLEDFRKVEHLIRSPLIKKRVAHVVAENYRVLESMKALKDGQVDALGKLMRASHISLRDNYEVTGSELDTLAETAWDLEYVAGARMTGAGFGGCTVNLVHWDKLVDFEEIIKKKYFEHTGLKAGVYSPGIGDGVKKI